MQIGPRTVRKLCSLALALAGAAAAWAAVAVRQARASDDGGPPLGAMCFASPAVALLIGAGAAWPRRADDSDVFGGRE